MAMREWVANPHTESLLVKKLIFWIPSACQRICLMANENILIICHGPVGNLMKGSMSNVINFFAPCCRFLLMVYILIMILLKGIYVYIK